MYFILWKNKTCLDPKNQLKWHMYSLQANSWSSPHCKCGDIVSSTFYCNLTHLNNKSIIHYFNRYILFRFDCITLSICCFSFICNFFTNILIKVNVLSSLKTNLTLTDITVCLDSWLSGLYTRWRWRRIKSVVRLDESLRLARFQKSILVIFDWRHAMKLMKNKKE